MYDWARGIVRDSQADHLVDLGRRAAHARRPPRRRRRPQPPDLDGAGVPALARDLRRAAAIDPGDPASRPTRCELVRPPRLSQRQTPSSSRCQAPATRRRSRPRRPRRRRRRARSSALARSQVHSWGPTVSSTRIAISDAELRGPLQRQPAVAAGQEAGPERVADAGRVDLAGSPAPRRLERRCRRGRRSRRPCSPSVVTRMSTALRDVGLGPAGLLQQQLPLVVVGEQVARRRRSAGGSSAPSIRASCCDGSAANGSPSSRHSSVCRTIALGVVGADHHQVQAAARATAASSISRAWAIAPA